mgnify:CR=1 FL=1
MYDENRFHSNDTIKSWALFRNSNVTQSEMKCSEESPYSNWEILRCAQKDVCFAIRYTLYAIR